MNNAELNGNSGPSAQAWRSRPHSTWIFSSSFPGTPTPTHTEWVFGDTHGESQPWASTGVLDRGWVAKSAGPAWLGCLDLD